MQVSFSSIRGHAGNHQSMQRLAQLHEGLPILALAIIAGTAFGCTAVIFIRS
jgi:hypothetical protein